MKILLTFLLLNSLVFCFNDDEKKAIRDIVRSELSKNGNINFNDEIVIKKISENILYHSPFIPVTQKKINEQISRKIKNHLNDFDIKKEVESEISENINKIIKAEIKNTVVDNNGFSFVYNVDQIVQGVREFYDSAWLKLIFLFGIIGIILPIGASAYLNKKGNTRLDKLEESAKELEIKLTNLINKDIKQIEDRVNNTLGLFTSNIINIAKSNVEKTVTDQINTSIENKQKDIRLELQEFKTNAMGELQVEIDMMSKKINCHDKDIEDLKVTNGNPAKKMVPNVSINNAMNTALKYFKFDNTHGGKSE